MEDEKEESVEGIFLPEAVWEDFEKRRGGGGEGITVGGYFTPQTETGV